MGRAAAYHLSPVALGTPSRNHTLMLPSLRVRNVEHSDYPKEDGSTLRVVCAQLQTHGATSVDGTIL